jgi:hypothetical protein
MANPKHLQILQRLLFAMILLAFVCGFVSWLMPSIPGYVILLAYALGCLMVTRAGRVTGQLLLAYGGLDLGLQRRTHDQGAISLEYRDPARLCGLLPRGNLHHRAPREAPTQKP